ncbi:L,D-transpeptidase family protein [Blastomonas sp.]|uniref:L,D-transpeptidase family protein n=1 Tax=Blastomonas TaxID=150203 RepID=UPI00258D93F8|nr:L,D-transpeptidase family protein [Blastomonas sp.]
MKRRLLGMAAALTLTIPAGLYALEFLEQDACLDSGGAWFGQLGCQTDLPKIDRILIKKSQRKLIALSGGKVAETMSVSLGREPVGQKHMEGDSRTPEGLYRITEHKRDSRYYRALRLGYPINKQITKAKALGVDPGGDIMIHGLPNGLGALGRAHLWMDWTRGCIALTNGEVDWLYQSTPDGTVVEIYP